MSQISSLFTSFTYIFNYNIFDNNDVLTEQPTKSDFSMTNLSSEISCYFSKSQCAGINISLRIWQNYYEYAVINKF